MNRKFLLLSLFLICFQALHTEEKKQINNKAESQETRSIVTETILEQDINATTFLGSNKFYIVTPANSDKSIARVAMSRNTEDGNWVVEFKAMAPSSGVTINNLTNQASPLNAKDLKYIETSTYTTNEKYPVTGFISGEDPNQKILIFQVLDLYEGKLVLKNADSNTPNKTEFPIKDTDSNNAKGLHSIATTKNKITYSGSNEGNLIFVLTSDNESFKDSELKKIGVTPIVVNDTYLNPLDATDFNKSEGSNKSINILNALKITGTDDPTLLDHANASMIWDDKLKTLYIALSNIQTTKTRNEGILALLIGKITSNKLIISPITDEELTADNKNLIIGYVNGDTKKQTINLHKIHTMHTSTGKDYILINGQVVQDSENDNSGNVIFALPLASDGKLSEIVENTDIKAIVGKDFHYLVHGDYEKALEDGKIKDLQIFGDTAYVAVAGSREKIDTKSQDSEYEDSLTGEAGIFTSTAIFNEDATIRAWTPWQRTMGYPDKVYNIGFDKNSSNYWYIGPDQKTAKITLWGSGDTNASGIHEGEPLSKALSDYFSEEDLGVIGLFNFDDETIGFQSWTPESSYPAFSMMIATGFNQVALIQTGARDEEGIFIPTKKFEAKKISEAGDTTNIFVFDSPKMPDLGFITCTEVSKIHTTIDVKRKTSPQNCGWIFIGGQNGVAVLCQSNGAGWDSTNGLSALSANTGSFPGTDYKFYKLNPPSYFNFSNLRKLASDGKYLYILTRTDLYRLEMNAFDFTGNAPINTDRLKHLAGVNNLFKDDYGNQIMNKDFDEFFDLLIVDNTDDAKKLLIGTTQGAWLSSQIADTFIIDNLSWNRKIDPTGSSDLLLLGPTLTFNFISTQRGGKFDANNQADGNLYITAIDSGFKHINVYRFNVNSGSVKLFNEPYNDQGITTPYFYRLADLGYLFAGLEFSGQLDHVANKYQITENLPLIPDPDKFLPVPNEFGELYYKAIDLGLDPQSALHLISIVQDTASGAPYIPGEFTVFVNE